MSLARAWSVALLGVEGHLVEVEAHVATGLPGLVLVGLPDASLGEARDRVRAAVVNSGLPWPGQRITVGLSPASLPKSGSAFDLSIAAAILAAAGLVPPEASAVRVLCGELGLDGRVRSTRGVLPSVVAAVRAGRDRVVVPSANASEAALVPGVRVEAVASLRGLVRLLRGESSGDPVPVPPSQGPRGKDPELADIVGQLGPRLALEVAAAGGHHLFLVGSPGAGKTMLAERLPGLLPALSDAEALEVTAVHSLLGVLPQEIPLVRRPPFRAPHHSATLAALVGGGGRLLRPGAVSAAHRGVLFLDEAPEFAAGVLDALRQPLECGYVEIARALASARFPARVQLVLAANPCPCAPARESDCCCTPLARRRYHGRISGALLDRVDVRQDVVPLSRADILDARPGEPTVVVAERVAAARAASARRWAQVPETRGYARNADVPGAVLRRRFPLPPAALAPASRALEQGRLSARGFDRVLRLAWTVADLQGRVAPGAAEVLAALRLRGLPAIA